MHVRNNTTEQNSIASHLLLLARWCWRYLKIKNPNSLEREPRSWRGDSQICHGSVRQMLFDRDPQDSFEHIKVLGREADGYKLFTMMFIKLAQVANCAISTISFLCRNGLSHTKTAFLKALNATSCTFKVYTLFFGTHNFSNGRLATEEMQQP